LIYTYDPEVVSFSCIPTKALRTYRLSPCMPRTPPIRQVLGCFEHLVTRYVFTVGDVSLSRCLSIFHLKSSWCGD